MTTSATPAHIEDRMARLEEHVTRLEDETLAKKTDLADLKVNLIYWVLGTSAVQATLILGVVALLLN